MAHKTENGYGTFRERFVRLPRELRDLIYAKVYEDALPIPMETIDADPSILTLFEPEDHGVYPEYKSEVLEAFYTHNKFIVTFLDPHHHPSRTQDVQWSPYPSYHKHIRNLSIHAQESLLSPTTDLEKTERSCLGRLAPQRSSWERLLSLPRLSRLTIRLQKRQNGNFAWADFSPVLIELRNNLPGVVIEFFASFDALLERYWTDPIWENNTQLGNVVELSYEPMGFVDMTELMGPPTEEDVDYVRRYCPDVKDASGRDVLIGLLDEFAPQRRALALHYMVKEPAILRIRMMEHYEVYKKSKMIRAGLDGGGAESMFPS